jgi:hypothetical protein
VNADPITAEIDRRLDGKQRHALRHVQSIREDLQARVEDADLRRRTHHDPIDPGAWSVLDFGRDIEFYALDRALAFVTGYELGFLDDRAQARAIEEADSLSDRVVTALGTENCTGWSGRRCRAIHDRVQAAHQRVRTAARQQRDPNQRQEAERER